MTFSIVAFDSKTRTWGVGSSTKFLAVGGILPWVQYGVGAIASQAAANLTYGLDGLSLLRNGKSASQVVNMLTAGDENRDVRQLSVIDAEGGIETFTGSSCVDYAGHRIGSYFSVQGNMLSGKGVVDALYNVMSTSTKTLPERIIDALEAGEAAGGDKRGRQSACLVVVGDADPVFERSGFVDPLKTNVNLRVDDSPSPIQDLRQSYAHWLDVFHDDEMLPIGEYRSQIDKGLEKRGYESLDLWAFDNNFTAKITESSISRRILAILMNEE